jgi:hypothetical protein
MEEAERVRSDWHRRSRPNRALDTPLNLIRALSAESRAVRLNHGFDHRAAAVSGVLCRA